VAVSPRTRLALVAAALVVLVVGFVIANGGGSDSTTDKAQTAPALTAAPSQPGGTQIVTTPSTTDAAAPAPAPATVNVVGGKPRGGIKSLRFKKGETIRFRVRSDVADEVHVHGYDVKKNVAPGKPVTFSIPAKIDGRFEVELEGRGEQIAQLEVQP
jgi:heme/copper-type cytochrome/quinol oxidase subunit 2